MEIQCHFPLASTRVMDAFIGARKQAEHIRSNQIARSSVQNPGSKDEMPDLGERVNHILTKQVFGVGAMQLHSMGKARVETKAE